MKVVVKLKADAGDERSNGVDPAYRVFENATSISHAGGFLEVTWLAGPKEMSRGWPETDIAYYEVARDRS